MRESVPGTQTIISGSGAWHWDELGRSTEREEICRLDNCRCIMQLRNHETRFENLGIGITAKNYKEYANKLEG